MYMNIDKWLRQKCGCSTHPQSPACVHEMAKAIHRIENLVELMSAGHFPVYPNDIDQVLYGREDMKCHCNKCWEEGK